MNDETRERLTADTDGLLTYEYIANHIDDPALEADLPWLRENMERVDLSGQFMASAARYLHAIDAAHFDPLAVDSLVEAVIERDREHRYLPELLVGLYGADYAERAAALAASDRNFRRIYQRLYPSSPL